MSEFNGGRGVDAVAFDHVSKRFGHVQALDGLSFRVEMGETVALLGPNGAGKSTAMDLLLGLRSADSGRVSVLGGTPHQAVTAGQVGGMLQTGAFPAGCRIRDVIDLVCNLYGNVRTRQEVLDLAGLSDLGDRWLQKLSGGQTQRVRFAMALAGRPRFLFLDEPTVALDMEARRRFWSIVRAVAADGAGVLFATHYMEEADTYADRILVLQKGRLIREGTPSGIRAAASFRLVRCTLADPDPDRIRALPGAADVTVHGHDVSIHSSDADATVGALYALGQPIRDLQVTGAGLEDALVSLTSDGR
ncbi:MAG TPA: ABC transporter ATP-binding protein [Candidatus Dormibacteraeota bacterium]|jgi:ABC-2 type transport system ATP-binding protein|nr:ABC transporter ATP-binding protein [Candidatus Dormibacteraeota bacterium]